jgi:thioredoxin-related protein
MKKNITLLFVLAATLTLNAQEKVNWVSFDKAIELNKEDPKPILVDIYTDWCGWCKRMDKDTYANPVIAEYINENYHAVKMDGEGKEPITYKEHIFKFKSQGRSGYHELSALLMDGKLSYPTTVILNKEEKLLDRIPGYIDAKKMEMALAYYIKKEGKETTWAQFSKNFKSNIK